MGLREPRALVGVHKVRVRVKGLGHLVADDVHEPFEYHLQEENNVSGSTTEADVNESLEYPLREQKSGGCHAGRLPVALFMTCIAFSMVAQRKRVNKW